MLPRCRLYADYFGSTCVAKQSIYTVGGTVQAGGGLYCPAKSMRNYWPSTCRTFAYVLTSRQMGKSSLVRTAERLAGRRHPRRH